MAFEKKEKSIHQPVLLAEVVRYLEPERGGWYLDGTLGGGGHTAALAHMTGAHGTVLAIDVDPELVARAERDFQETDNVVITRENYRNSLELMREMKIYGFDGIILDLGFSSFHVERGARGFTFNADEVLDMRYDRGGGELSAGDVVNECSKEEIREILWKYGEERQAGRIASAILSERKMGEIRTSGQLREIIEKAKGKKFGKKGIHPATKTFQALRIFVNRELENLEHFLIDLPLLLKDGGSAAIISYHSLEDRLVKSYFRRYSGVCMCEPGLPACLCGRKRIMKVLTPRPVRPTEEEISLNRRARSARLRVARKEEAA